MINIYLIKAKLEIDFDLIKQYDRLEKVNKLNLAVIALEKIQFAHKMIKFFLYKTF